MELVFVKLDFMEKIAVKRIVLIIVTIMDFAITDNAIVMKDILGISVNTALALQNAISKVPAKKTELAHATKAGPDLIAQLQFAITTVITTEIAKPESANVSINGLE